MTSPKKSAAAVSLSIVIPAIGDTAALEDTLVSVLENRPDDCEVVVPLGCPYDDPWGIRDEVRFVQAPVGSGLVTCTNLGIASSAGSVVHVLAAGWRATPGWTDSAVAHFADDSVAAVVPLGVSAEDHDRVVSAGIRVTRGGRRTAVVPRGNAAAERVDVSKLRSSGPALEAGFWRADVLAAIGPGFASCCGGLLADADMANAIASLDRTVVVDADSRVVWGTPRPSSNSFQAGLHAERLFWRSLARGSIVSALVPHAVEICRDAVARAPFATLPMLVGRLIGSLQFGSAMARIRELRGLRRDGIAGLEDPATESPTLRIDAGHADAFRPRQRSSEPTPLRRSA